jgi:hypothetical protein
MDNLKLLLVDRLKSQGMHPALIPAFLKAFTSIITTEPDIDVVQVNQKLHALGWNEISIDYHSLEIAMACLVAVKEPHQTI